MTVFGFFHSEPEGQPQGRQPGCWRRHRTSATDMEGAWNSWALGWGMGP